MVAPARRESPPHVCMPLTNIGLVLSEVASLQMPPGPTQAQEATITEGEAANLRAWADGVYENFVQTGFLQYLEIAIGTYHDILDHTPIRYPAVLRNLACSLAARFKQTNNIQDANEAISLLRETSGLQPAPHPDRPDVLNNLACTLQMRFSQTGNNEDMNESVALHREALKLLPALHPHRSGLLNSLATTLNIRFSYTGNIEDVNEAVALHREALELQPAPHPDRPDVLNNLVLTLRTRFKQAGNIEDLDESVSLLREALKPFPASDALRSNLINNLAETLAIRYDHTGNIEFLSEMIDVHRAALGLFPVPHPLRPISLNNLANKLCSRFHLLGNVEDINEAIPLLREAIELQLVPNLHRHQSLNNLACILSVRFQDTGDIQDVTEAISLHREVLELQPANHPGHVTSLNNLSSVLCTRFEQKGDIEDLNEAVSLSREAICLRSADHADYSKSLHVLASALHERFCQAKNIEDVEESISLHRESLRLRPTHPIRAVLLSDLASALHTRFRETDDITDVNEAISLQREALSLQSATHPARSMSLNHLATFLTTRFDQTGNAEDINEAVTLFQAALQLLPQSHPDHSRSSLDLGKSYLNLYALTQQSVYQDDAIACFRDAVACQSAPTLQSYEAALAWSYLTDGNHHSALEAFQFAIDLLRRLVTLGLGVHSRQRLLVRYSDGLARKAAACAIRSGQCHKAVEMLESGRAIFWSQALQLRTPLDKLISTAPELAQRLQHISRALERGALRDSSANYSDTQRRRSMEQENERFQHLNDEWLKKVDEVRKLDGLHDFLRPKSLDTLQKAASNGPIVILNACESGCDALLITSSGVRHVALPRITFNDVKALVQRIRAAISPGSAIAPLFQLTYDPFVRIEQHGLDNSYSSPLVTPSRRDVQHIPVESDDMSQSPSVPYSEHISDRLQRPWAYAGACATDTENIFMDVLATLWGSIVEPVIIALGLQVTSIPTFVFVAHESIRKPTPLPACGGVPPAY
jgi:tetratricopeptide (TPR) repeat protein